MTAQAQGRTFKRAGNVTLELLKIVAGKSYFVRFTGDMHLGKEVAAKVEVDPTTGEVKTKKKDPAYVAFVDNLEDGQPRQIIVSTVMRKELDEAFPNFAYVGKSFEFSIQRPSGKEYNVPQIFQLEDETDDDKARTAAVIAAFEPRKQELLAARAAAQAAKESGAPAAAATEDKPKAGKK